MHPENNERPTSGSTDIARGDRLVWEIYDSLRKGKEGLFDRTLLLITFDEHGGFFDRESPPTTVHPSGVAAVRHPITFTRRLVSWFYEHKGSPFDFKRLGVRVPAVVISPRVQPGVDDTEYDHTSVVRTVRELFAPDQEPLGARAKAANTFWHLVGPQTRPMPDIPAPDYPPLPQLEEEEAPPPPPSGPATQGDDLAHQLAWLATKVEGRLRERVTTELVFAEDASPTERVDALLRAWSRE